ncbi:MAG: phosphatase PAP2 family protein, partial [Methanobacteriales archaeon]|nr:phosphatase PAP2 family protein [Methanobacteriales archaeon]
LKIIFQVPRPFEVIEWVRHTNIVWGYSLPSGHTTAAFSGFLILGVKYGRIPIFLSLAALVGISRIYMGLHYPSDVIMGALLGVSCALVSLRIEEKFFKSLKDKYQKG